MPKAGEKGRKRKSADGIKMPFTIDVCPNPLTWKIYPSIKPSNSIDESLPPALAREYQIESNQHAVDHYKLLCAVTEPSTRNE